MPINWDGDNTGEGGQRLVYTLRILYRNSAIGYGKTARGATVADKATSCASSVVEVAGACKVAESAEIVICIWLVRCDHHVVSLSNIDRQLIGLVGYDRNVISSAP